MKIEVNRLLREVSDSAWLAIDRAMEAGGRTEDVIVATALTHASIAVHRRFGGWCEKIRDIELTYLDGLALRLQEVDDGDIALAQVAANALSRAREACGDRPAD